MPPNDTIFQRLNAATAAERAALALALDEKLTRDTMIDVVMLSKELRADAGNSFKNLLRKDHDLEYRSILDDVVVEAARAAGWDAPKVSAGASELWIEDYIVQAFAFAARKKDATEADKAQAREAAEQAIVGKSTPSESERFSNTAAAAASKFFVGHPLVLMTGLAALGIAWAAGPAMRRVVPAVLALIFIRKRTETESSLQEAS